MSEETKRASVNGKPSSEDRKPPSPSADKRVIVKSADMADDLQKEAVNIAIAAFEKNNVEKDVAESIKKEFDKKHGPTWHCIVGRNFVNTISSPTRRGSRCMSCPILATNCVTESTVINLFWSPKCSGIVYWLWELWSSIYEVYVLS
ncbi:hypothetical protein KSS87_003741 [Heliosperma pusillum]|nr:hypothetical protein KSS87_003741 [Heliosperma pusillum]